MNNFLQPVYIVDKNGKQTTVHKRMDTGVIQRTATPLSPEDSARRTSMDIQRIPEIPIDSISPMSVRRKMGDTVYGFAEQNGGETSIAVPVGSRDSEERWLRDRAWSSRDEVEKGRYLAIAYTLANPDAMKATSAHGRAAEYAETKIGMNYPIGTMQSIYNSGQAIEDRFPDMSVEQKAEGLKRRLGSEITAEGVRINEVPAEKIWAGYEAYAGFMEVEAQDLNWS